jgi:hypothetical protein
MTADCGIDTKEYSGAARAGLGGQEALLDLPWSVELMRDAARRQQVCWLALGQITQRQNRSVSIIGDVCDDGLVRHRTAMG